MAKPTYNENEEIRFPLTIQFRDVPESDAVAGAIWDHVKKLEQFYDRIVSCHVVFSAPHRSRHQGRIYHVQIRLFVPGRDIFICSEPERDGAHEDAYVAMRDAFAAARRQLEDHVRRLRGEVKGPHHEGRAVIKRIFTDDGYGFLMTPDNREIYFHENSILKGSLSSLHVGDEVRFHEEMGEKGPQVTSMAKV